MNFVIVLSGFVVVLHLSALIFGRQRSNRLLTGPKRIAKPTLPISVSELRVLRAMKFMLRAFFGKVTLVIRRTSIWWAA